MLVLTATPIDPAARLGVRSVSFDRSEVTIGRSRHADFVLESDQISRLAIKIVVSEGEMALIDESAAGSTINGQRGWGRRVITEADDIRLGPYRLAVKWTD